MSLKIEINAEEILSQFKDFKDQVKADLEAGLEKMVFDAHIDIVQRASLLPSEVGRAYRKALNEPTNIAPHVWVISLNPEGLWIEEFASPKMDMKPGLLKGQSHRVIPFKYSGKGAQTTPLAQGLVAEIKQRMGSDFLNKLEKDKKGKVKMGKVSEHDFSGDGRNMSWVRRRVDETHPLKRLTAYQSRDKSGRARRDVLIFRTVTDGPKSAGKWLHPGLNKKLMDAAMEKAAREWEDKMLPSIIAKWSTK